MANIKLYPPYGTIKQSSSVKFEISDVGIDKFKLNMENATDGVKIDVKHIEEIDGVYAGVMDLNIPEHSSQSSISVFAHIEELQSDGSYKTFQICPSLFDVTEEFDNVNNNIIVSPSFVGQEDLCAIKIKGEPLSTTAFSVNDKIMKVMINEAGYGSIHFKGSDLVGTKELESLNKIPVYVYEGEHSTNKVFSGSYVNILPSNIALHAAIDPRCDINDEDWYVDPMVGWIKPAECDLEPCDLGVDVCPCDPRVEDCDCNPQLESCTECNPERDNCFPPEVCTQALDIPIDCSDGSIDIGSNTCRIHSAAATLLNNGMVLHAFTSPDTEFEADAEADEFNINRIFLSAQQSTPTIGIIASKDIVVESKEEDEEFRFHVDNETWEALSAFEDLNTLSIYVVLYDALFGYKKIRISRLESNEYLAEDVVIGEVGETKIALDSWVFCVNSVFFDLSAAPPETYLNSSPNVLALPFVRNEFETGGYAQPVNVSIASNSSHVGVELESYVYIIVEAITENKLSQLYFNSLSLGRNNLFTQQSYGWVRLTDETHGNNRNPVAKMDSSNNLHVVFESDRAGINQLYYGNIGLDRIKSAAATFSASVDKYSEFLSTGKVPFDYLKPLLLKTAVDTPEFVEADILSENWTAFTGDGGNVSFTDSSNYLRDMVIISNPVNQEAMATTPLAILSDLDPPNLELIQYNYQISFDMEATVAQDNSVTTDTTVSDTLMDNLFEIWKKRFTISIDKGVDNQPVYIDSNSNKFGVGRVDNVFDRIVPLVGAYKHDEDNPSLLNTQIRILKQDINLKDFTFGLMFEKTIFKATNIEPTVEYVSRGFSASSYSSEEIETIYTGRAKLVAFIRTTEDSDTRADYIIVREFPEPIDVSEISTYDIMVNYVKEEKDPILLQYHRVPSLPTLYLMCGPGACPDEVDEYIFTEGIDGITVRFVTGTVTDAIRIENIDTREILIDTGQVSHIIGDPLVITLYKDAELIGVRGVRITVIYNQFFGTGFYYDVTEFVSGQGGINSNSYLGTLSLFIDGVPRFSQSFETEIDPTDYNYFDIGFGVPSGGYYVADKMSPSKLGIFDDISATLDLSNIKITSPTYTYNDEVVSLPPMIRDLTKFKIFEESLTIPSSTVESYSPDGWDNEFITLKFESKKEIKYWKEYIETEGNRFSEEFNVEDFEEISVEFSPGSLPDRMIISEADEYETVLHDTDFIVTAEGEPVKFDVGVSHTDSISITVEVGDFAENSDYSFKVYFKNVVSDNAFIQTPITFEGINQSVDLDVGICDDLHMAWQSNRSKHWDIYYANSFDSLSPFRHETQITNTESNSIKPSVSVSRTGSRMIAWNDNRGGDYTIFAARSLTSSGCNQKTCEVDQLEDFKGKVEECSISFNKMFEITGIYDLGLYFYTDSNSTTLFKTIILEGNESRWFVNGVSIIDRLVYEDNMLTGASFDQGIEYTISYQPSKDDKIFDIILYVKLHSVLKEEVI